MSEIKAGDKVIVNDDYLVWRQWWDVRGMVFDVLPGGSDTYVQLHNEETCLRIDISTDNITKVGDANESN